jgi:chemotaxis protein CheD
MNHFLLPEPHSGISSTNAKYGAYLMELLVNDLLKCGASRTCLRAKFYGGSRMNASFSSVGERNIEFVRKYLTNEDIPIESEDVGGCSSRRITFFPTTGKVELRHGTGNIDDASMNLDLPGSKCSEVVLF